MKHCFFIKSVADGYELRREIPHGSSDFELIFHGERIRLRCRLDDDALRAEFTLLTGALSGIVSGIETVIPDWSPDNYLLIPAAVYDGNRAQVRADTYPPTNPPGLRELDPPLHTADISGFRKGGGGVIEQTTGDMALTGIGYFDPAAHESRWIGFPDRNLLGNYGCRLEERTEERELLFTITSPVFRDRRQIICTRLPAGDRAAVMSAGGMADFNLTFSRSRAAGIPDLFRQMRLIRPDITAPPHPDLLPLSCADRLIKEKYLRSNWDEEAGYFRVAAESRSPWICCHWQAGWIGGGIATCGMLFDGDAELRDKSRRNLETLFTRGQAPSGLYYGAAIHGRYFSDSFREPTPDRRLLLRKNADVLFFGLKQLAALERRGEPAPGAWRDSLFRNAAAIASIWERYHQFGQWIDIDTREIITGGSAGAVLAVGALALASEYFGEKRFMDAACEAAEYYTRNYLGRGILNGAPGEILQACDSEAGYAMLESLTTLHEITRRDEYLDAAEAAADYCLSWCVAENRPFPPDSPFGRLRMHSRGAVWANVQNKHAAPGFCTGSGVALLKLFRAGGDRLWMDLLRDVVHAMPQFVSRPDRPIADLEPGWINERVNLSDWEGPEMVGNVFRGSCWPEVSLMLAFLEVPGVYVDADAGRVWCLDHVRADLDDGLLTLRNPTKFQARVKVLAENAADRRKPWVFACPEEFREYRLAPGQSVQIPVAGISGERHPRAPRPLPSAVRNPAAGAAVP